MALRSEQHIVLPSGRTLGYAEYGDPQGKPVFLFHGIPGSRMLQHPQASIAMACQIRLIVPDRPGVGLSDFQTGRQLLDWPADIAELADRLEIERFIVAGYSGGGPYASACAYALPQRVICAGLISSVGPIAASGVLRGMLASNRMGYVVGRWLPWFLWRLLFDLYYRKVAQQPEKLVQPSVAEPAADRLVLESAGVRQMFIRNFAEAFRQGTRGTARDGWLLARPWGFALVEITRPVFLWQGEADVVVTPAMGRYMAAQIRQCEATFYPGEGHLAWIKHWSTILKTLIQEHSRCTDRSVYD